MEYQDAYILPTHEEVEHAFQSDDSAAICQTLVSLALCDEDWKKVEGYCLQFLEHVDAGVRMVAATCIGHLARIHQQLDLDLVLPALYRHQSDQGKYVAGNVDNALDDIEIFMNIPVKHDPSMVTTANKEEEDDDDEEEEEEDERPPTVEEVEQAFESGVPLQIERTLVALAFHDPDWRRTEDYCLQFLEHADDDVRGVAAECISYLIYNQYHLDVDAARSALSKHLSDPNPYVKDRVKSALRDIDLFVKRSAEHHSSTEDEYVAVGPDPTNGQRALDNSVSMLPGNPRYRIGIDLCVGEIVVFGESGNGKYSGDVRNWEQLTPMMKDSLMDNGLILENGGIILRDARGNRIATGKNMITRDGVEKEYVPRTREEIEQVFQSDDLMEISRILLALALHDPDWKRTQDYCFQFLEHTNSGMRGFAAECISHLIYNQHHVDTNRARFVLSRHQQDPTKYVARNVTYALDDIELFMKSSM